MRALTVTTCCLLALSLAVLVAGVPAAPAFIRLLPQDCHEIFRSGVQRNGVYTIYPSGSTPVDVYCGMGCSEDSSRAWTVIQRRMDGSVNFYRGWDQYKYGFGNKSGEYWLGLEHLYMMTHNKLYELKVDIEDYDGNKASATYTVFFVSSEENGYMLKVEGFIDGGAGDSLSYHNGLKFSTYDKEQNPYGCARQHLGAFWYYACYGTNPNGIYLGRQDGTHYGIGNVWTTWRGLDYGLKTITMKIRPRP
ncbi:microfibril-associated glycoprotein 4-like [Hemibagrus wyckioides]|uniref:microfibril-associated glycoprotein 4-like n=1 Tax=Hemibagrus wyckioides TaxID=337641 RepID=UPI00266CA4CE|nr:microfibril-associated glycoprotein 4-like [Hemibagrus wyckioides]